MRCNWRVFLPKWHVKVLDFEIRFFLHQRDRDVHLELRPFAWHCPVQKHFAFQLFTDQVRYCQAKTHALLTDLFFGKLHFAKEIEQRAWVGLVHAYPSINHADLKVHCLWCALLKQLREASHSDIFKSLCTLRSFNAWQTARWVITAALQQIRLELPRHVYLGEELGWDPDEAMLRVLEAVANDVEQDEL